MIFIQKQPPEVFYRKIVFQNFAKFTGKHLLHSFQVSGQICNFIKKETLAKVFSCEFFEIFKNTFLTEQLRATASGHPSLNVKRHM